MGKAGRIVCISIPLVLSACSLASLMIVFLGGLSNQQSSQALYHYRIDNSEFKSKVANGMYMVQGSKLADGLLNALENSVKSNDIEDFYNVYLWNYCAGNKNTVSYCSPHKAQYYFDPLQAWGLNNTLQADRYIPLAVASPMRAFSKGVRWLFVAYIISMGMALATMIVGLFGICSRVGSLVTTIVAATTTLFTFLTALTSTILFGVLVGAWSEALKPYMVTLSTGKVMFALDWMAFAFSLGATLFWGLSSCFCSPHSRRSKKRAQNLKAQGKSLIGTATNTSYSPFASRGYKPIDDQEKSLLKDPEAHDGGIELQEPSSFKSGGPYKGREESHDIGERYEPFRPQSV